MVFLIQNTQNRDTAALHLKLDELIRALKGAHNELLNIEELSDKELEDLHCQYKELAEKIKKHIERGEAVNGSPKIIFKKKK